MEHLTPGRDLKLFALRHRPHHDLSSAAMIAAFLTYYAIVLLRMSYELTALETNHHWVKEHDDEYSNGFLHMVKDFGF